MPAYETLKPISVSIDIWVGDVQITAEDRTDTVVEVRPTDPGDASDVKAAEQTTVEFTEGVLSIRAPRPSVVDFSQKNRSVDVTIALPTGSHLRGKAALGDLHLSGRLGECTYKTSTANVTIDHVASLRLETAGHITVGRVDGDAEVSTSIGRIRLGEIDGAAAVKNSSGDTEIVKVGGDLHVRASNGDIAVQHALGLKTDAKTANGSIRVGEVVRGAVALKTSCGDLELGIGADRPARLDLSTGYGRVNNALENAGKSFGETIEVRAQSSYGDITINRA